MSSPRGEHTCDDPYVVEDGGSCYCQKLQQWTKCRGYTEYCEIKEEKPTKTDEVWNVKLPSGKSYKCIHRSYRESTLFSFWKFRISISYVSLGRENGDIRLSFTWGKTFVE
jgi:hypothetical protein